MRLSPAFALPVLVILVGAPRLNAQVKPGDVITKDNASKVQSLLSPGNLVMVQQGMQLNIVASDKLEWPPPYKAATEKYSSQVHLLPDATLQNYVAGQPFPLLDPNDPQAKGLGYVSDGSQVDRKANPNFKPEQQCANCVQYQGKPTDAEAPCTIFMSKLVPAKGWCKVWAKKPA